MAWCQGMVLQSLLTLLIQGALLVLKGEMVVGQNLMDLDCLLLCGAGTPNISQGVPSPPSLYCICLTCHAQSVCCASSAQASPKTSPPSLADVVEDTCGDDESCQVLLMHFEACAGSPPVHLEVAESSLHHHAAPFQAVF